MYDTVTALRETAASRRDPRDMAADGIIEISGVVRPTGAMSTGPWDSPSGIQVEAALMDAASRLQRHIDGDPSASREFARQSLLHTAEILTAYLRWRVRTDGSDR